MKHPNHNHNPLPDNCPVVNGEECPEVTKVEEGHEKRRRSDGEMARLGRLVLWIGGIAAGAGGGGWYVRQTSEPEPPSIHVDRQAREDIRLLRVEIGGKLDLLAQQQIQIKEQITELKHNVSRRNRNEQ